MATAVDPFIPVKHPTAPTLRPKPALVNNVAAYMTKSRSGSMDFKPAAPGSRSPAVRPARSALAPSHARESSVVQPDRLPGAAGRPSSLPARNALLREVEAGPVKKPEQADESKLKRNVKKPASRLWNKVQLLLAAAVIIVVGILMQSLLVGELCILVYAVFAIIKRVPSHISFGLAGISLVSILVLMRVNNYSPLAGNFAVYAFMLLAIGVVTLVRETIQQNKARAKA